ncbi:bifunctional prephenate dehydrogenase/3-phosphoshikimate 1-carboxyvinyltransferase [Marinomonas sp. M1K-6]|uniref:prephenate dehydrogenase n=1 Tax=Marinomonas profundi TaxID=2726122 RepID=A0A847QZ59_9GAMM|nr:bifunctional prephenate dehydrogenase/3-phosphoshikimate 1-carboxyvinyltransferase [Marinomonas profundi]NLQ16085.1 bifunctional prephenate dehydrogenase/3-phosphoshikimate 1-carboxyvinyltransferase [Marinomonas profundi]UDV03328.1 bifunctional prephenate dehydrogenase/3-phosphoshikimate 1-carboxyvinyltransferase [Marinomonas profundi]
MTGESGFQVSVDVTPQEKKKFGNVMIIGLGMIGGSFAKALKERGLATLYGVDRRAGELTLGVSTGVIDYPADLSSDFIAKMDVIVLATPVRAMESVLADIKPFLSERTLITDVGSTKGSVVAAIRRVFGCVPTNFIPGHPIAGAEKSGVLASNSQLFEKHMAIVTPLPDSNPILLDRLHRLWRAVGADVVSMDVDHHDHVLASSSHLPHLLAYTLVDALANGERSQDVFKFAAGGFRDFTRIASSDPVMWRDVFLANKDATLATLDHFTDRLADMRTAIEQGDGASMFGVFTRAKSARDHFLRLLEQRTLGSVKEARPISVSVLPASAMKGAIALLGDKSLSHKTITIAALSEGVSEIKNIDLTGDVRITMQAFRDMGVVIEEVAMDQLRIHGVGLRGLKAPIAPINVHQSRESLYLLLPVLAGQSFTVVVAAEGKLLNQSMGDLFSLVRQMGGQVVSEVADCLPVSLVPGVASNVSIDLQSGSESLRMAAFLAALYSPTQGQVKPWLSGLSHSDVLLRHFGATMFADGDGFSVKPASLMSTNLTLSGDEYETAWLVLLANLLPGSELAITNAGLDSVSFAYLRFLQSIGADVTIPEQDGFGSYEGVVKAAFAELRGFLLTPEQSYQFRDKLPLLCVAAVYATGESRIQGINALPYYYEDRVLALVDALAQMKIVCTYENGDLLIKGGLPLGGELDCAGDDKLALAMLALGSRSQSVTKVNDCQKLLEEFNELESVSVQLGFHCTVTQ